MRRHRSVSPRCGTCLRDATTGAASVRCHRSIPTHCGTCLRFALAGAAHSRQPLPGQSVIGTILRPRSAAAAVRCAPNNLPCSSNARRLLPCAACCRSHLLLVGAGNNSTPRCPPLKIQLSAQIGAQNAMHASLPAASVSPCCSIPTF